jgi:hypothetical protein
VSAVAGAFHICGKLRVQTCTNMTNNYKLG